MLWLLGGFAVVMSAYEFAISNPWHGVMLLASGLFCMSAHGRDAIDEPSAVGASTCEHGGHDVTRHLGQAFTEGEYAQMPCSEPGCDCDEFVEEDEPVGASKPEPHPEVRQICDALLFYMHDPLRPIDPIPYNGARAALDVLVGRLEQAEQAQEEMQRSLDIAHVQALNDGERIVYLETQLGAETENNARFNGLLQIKLEQKDEALRLIGYGRWATKGYAIGIEGARKCAREALGVPPAEGEAS
jgi:hypothetical protein